MDGDREEGILSFEAQNIEWDEWCKEGRCMMATAKTIMDRAHFLVDASVNDLQSSLYTYQWNVKKDVETIRHGLKLCERRGEKTKATLLKRKLNQMEKERIRAIYLERLDKAFKEAENAKANPT